jgi:hypothetical protein
MENEIGVDKDYFKVRKDKFENSILRDDSPWSFKNSHRVDLEFFQ